MSNNIQLIQVAIAQYIVTKNSTRNISLYSGCSRDLGIERERSCIEISFRMIRMDFKRFDENYFWRTTNLKQDLHLAEKCRREKFPAIQKSICSPLGGGVLDLRSYREVPLENL